MWGPIRFTPLPLCPGFPTNYASSVRARSLSKGALSVAAGEPHNITELLATPACSNIAHSGQ